MTQKITGSIPSQAQAWVSGQVPSAMRVACERQLTVTRGMGEMGGDSGEKRRRFFRNIYKGHMDKTKSGVGSRVGSGDDWGGETGRGKMETTILEQQQQKVNKIITSTQKEQNS